MEILIKKHKKPSLSRIISFGFHEEASRMSVFSETERYGKKYRLVGFLATLPDGTIIGGLNGNLQPEAFFIDEIWVKEEYRGMFIGRRLIQGLKRFAQEKEVPLCCYPHLMEYDRFFKANNLVSYGMPESSKGR